MVKIVRLSRSTIVQRLTDFGKTASSKLTIEEFNKIDLEEEADPPSFTKARQRAKQAQVYEEKMKLNSAELLAQLALTQERVEVGHLDVRSRVASWMSAGTARQSTS